jgi:hypothetical protein
VIVILEKVEYKDNETVIRAKNLNDIQDAVIANQEAIEDLKITGAAQTIVDAVVE